MGSPEVAPQDWSRQALQHSLADHCGIGVGSCRSYCDAQAGQTPVRRKIASQVAPTYYELARKLRLVGLGKLKLVIATSGRLKATEVMGGNPSQLLLVGVWIYFVYWNFPTSVAHNASQFTVASWRWSRRCHRINFAIQFELHVITPG